MTLSLGRLRELATVMGNPVRRRAALRKRALAVLDRLQDGVESASVFGGGRDLAGLRRYQRLNFGCGQDKRPGFVNVDLDPACEPDVLIRRQDLAQFPTSFYDEIVAKDVLEHIRRDESLSVLLRFNDWLSNGGVLHLSTTSILGVADRIRKYASFEHDLGMTICLFGSQAHAGDYHYTGFTERTLAALLVAAGFEPGPFSLADEWMFVVDARKTWSWSAEVSDGGAHAEFVKSLYRRALGRAPRRDELEGFSSELTAGRQTRKEVAHQVYGSHERLLYCAQTRS